MEAAAYICIMKRCALIAFVIAVAVLAVVRQQPLHAQQNVESMVGTVAQLDTDARTPAVKTGSLRFEDARAGTLSEVHVGDQLRALGDQSADARSFVAEQIVSGAFKTIGVTVVEIDQQKREIHATTLDQKRPVTIAFNQDSA